jgi:hypothetical protein
MVQLLGILRRLFGVRQPVTISQAPYAAMLMAGAIGVGGPAIFVQKPLQKAPKSFSAAGASSVAPPQPFAPPGQ